MSDKTADKKRAVLSINYTVLLPMILLFIITALVSSLLFFKTHSENIENQIALYQDMVLEKSALKLDNLMEKPHFMNATLHNAIINDPGLVTNLEAMRKVILNYLSIYPTIMAGGLGIEKSGNFIAAGRHVNGGFDSAIHQSEVSPTYNYYKLDDWGRPSELLLSRESYDLKNRSWYKNAVETGIPGWSSVYAFAGRSGIGLTAVLPIYEESVLLGVIQSAFTLNFINDFLDEIPMAGKHRIYIIEGSGSLIGTSGETDVVHKDSEGKLKRISWDKIKDEIIRNSYESGAIELSINQSDTVPFESEGQTYYLKSRSYAGSHSLDWTIVTADLKDDFISELRVTLRQNLIISLIAALIFLILGIFILRNLIEPVRNLNSAVKEFPEDFQIINIEKKGPSEIRELMIGFHTMSRQINHMVSNMRKTVETRTEELEKSKDQIEALSGLVPICANCKKIRDDKGFWNNLESYIERHTDALFSHGLCQDCADELYGKGTKKKND